MDLYSPLGPLVRTFFVAGGCCSTVVSNSVETATGVLEEDHRLLKHYLRNLRYRRQSKSSLRRRMQNERTIESFHRAAC